MMTAMTIEEEQKRLRQRPKVLVVDDREAERNILQRLLNKLDLDVYTAESGESALQQLIKQEFTLILLDIQMPIMDGIETARFIRINPLTENIPIIFLTAYDQDEIKVLQGYEIGAIDYLIKPINEEILLSKVKTFIRSNSIEKEKEYERILSELRAKNKKLNSARQEALDRLKDANEAKDAAQLAKQELERQTEELLRRTKELEQFAYVATHDLRAPIINLEGIVKIFRKRGYANEVNGDIFQRIEFAVTRIKTTLHDLIEVVSSNAVNEEKAQKIKFEEIFAQVLGDLELQVRETDALIEIDFTEVAEIYYIPRFLNSVLQNLLSNALKYRSKDRRLHISVCTQRYDEGVRLIVKDNGIGIDETKKDKVFGLFQRLSKDTSGKGIGLYITRSHVESQGGSIDFKSKNGQGVEFIVNLKSMTEEPLL